MEVIALTIAIDALVMTVFWHFIRRSEQRRTQKLHEELIAANQRATQLMLETQKLRETINIWHSYYQPNYMGDAVTTFGQH